MADAHWSKYDTLYRFIGSHGSTAFQDYFGFAPSVTIVGSAQITTAVADPFANNNGVLSLPGSALIKTASCPALSGNFSIGGWFRSTSSGFQVLFSVGRDGVDTAANCLQCRYHSGSGNLEVVAGATVLCSVAIPASNAWHRIEVSRQSGTIKGLLNGTGFGTASNSAPFGTSGFAVGDRHGAEGTAFVGQVSDFYIANGDVVNWDNYTLPTSRIAAPYITGTVRDSSNALVQRAVCAYNRTTKALVATGLSDPTTGVFNLEVLSTGRHFVMAFDDTDPPDENALVYDYVLPL